MTVVEYRADPASARDRIGLPKRTEFSREFRTIRATERCVRIARVIARLAIASSSSCCSPPGSSPSSRPSPSWRSSSTSRRPSSSTFDQGFPDRHDVDAAVRRRALRHPAARVGHADRHRSSRCSSRSRSARSSRSTCREFATHRLREIVKPILELLGAVPTVVYGYFALLMVTPLLQKLMPEPAGLQHAERRPRDRHHDRAVRRAR